MNKANPALNVRAALLISAATVLATPLLNAQTTPGPMPSICVRSCWGARAPACQPGNISALTRAIVHHTAGTGDWTTNFETGKSRVRGVQNYHIDVVGFCDISYHFVINAGGHIYEGRNGALSGLPKGYHDCCNVNSFAFNVMGYYHPPYNQTFTQASFDSLNATIAWRMPSGWSPYGSGAYCGATVGTLDGHRRVAICNNGSAGGSACPGDGIYNVFITDNRNGGPIRDNVASRRTSFRNPPYYFGTGSEGWFSVNAISPLTWTDCCGWPGIIYADQWANDAFISSPATSFVGGNQGTINISLYAQNGTTDTHDIQLFWNQGGGLYNSPTVTYKAKDSWATINLDVDTLNWAGKTITSLRLDFDSINQGNRWIVNHIIPQIAPKFYFGANTEGWTLGNGLSGLTWTDCCGWPGIIYADQTGNDAFLYSPPISFWGGCNDVLHVRVYPQNGTTANHDMQLTWSADGGITGVSSVVNYTAQNSWALVTIPVGGNANWNGRRITSLRLDLDTTNTGVRWIIDYARLQQATVAQ